MTDQGSGIGSEEVRAAVARLPGTEERSHHGHPDFRVGGRIFATLWPAQNRSVLRLTQEDAEGMANLEPETFRLVSSRRGPYAWLNVDLAQISAPQFERLLREAWRLRSQEETHPRR
ncbi:MAG: MmcQ/YjbR family DNA-binding protein [Candidatus Dormibacteraeota bacterium]|nr:MmcQ/YjbR family DNA-binding protein [Candidatus Dormibacteraeota bacterium]